MSTKAIEAALKTFDGKAITILSEIRAEFGDRRNFRSELVRLAAHDEANVSVGATWLIKDLVENGVRLTRAQTDDLMGQLDAVSSWAAQLHICQSVQHFDMSEQSRNTCADWLEPLLRSDRPFLRAWSMDALQHLARRSTQLAGRAEAALKAAEQDPSASVRARARNVRKQAKRQ